MRRITALVLAAAALAGCANESGVSGSDCQQVGHGPIGGAKADCIPEYERDPVDEYDREIARKNALFEATQP